MTFIFSANESTLYFENEEQILDTEIEIEKLTKNYV